VPSLVLGPLLRYVGERDAVIWVETDGPCEVGALGYSERSFQVEGHHYAIVRIRDLEPSTWHEYELTLDGERAWPLPGSSLPPSAFRTYPRREPLEIAFGSCRVSAPHEPPYTLRVGEHPDAVEIDALHALAVGLLGRPREERPDLLFLCGDQVYADDNISPATREFIERRRGDEGPEGVTVVDFEEYAHLYREAWSEPALRWLLSTVPSAMVFDDHDVHDDWNTSAAWVADMRRQGWWQDHIESALMSYWIYQHLGNKSPAELDRDPELRAVREADDGGAALREFARRADREPDSYRWSFHRDLDRTRLLVADSRASRVLAEGRRSMVDEAEWHWLGEQASGGIDHLLLGTSLPVLLAPGMHELEAWNEAVCGGAWGPAAARLGERLRRALDLEHWAAFDESFRRLAELLRSLAAGERGAPPASIVMLSGDVHHSYVSEVAFARGAGARSAVWQAVCSPVRHPLGGRERSAFRLALTRPFEIAARALARAAGVEDPPIRWRRRGGPWFDNLLATLTVDGRRLSLRMEKALPPARLETVLERPLA
jgi:hypothetical protein